MPLIYDSSAPIAVTDEQNRLLGVIIRGRVIEALANIPEEDDTTIIRTVDTEQEVADQPLSSGGAIAEQSK